MRTVYKKDYRLCACGRTIMSTTGRTKCRECHRKSVVWANPVAQMRDQCAGFAAPPEQKRQFKQLEGAEAGEHLLSLCRMLGAFDFSPVKSLRAASNFSDLCRQYGGVPA